MPSVLYDNKFTQQRIGPVKIPTPKRIEDPMAWYRAARKAIPEIPDIKELDQDGRAWFLEDWITSSRAVLLPMRASDDTKSNIAFDRTVAVIG